ncbi:hypothetical protein PN498_28300 [Oscillatoria sp. CS-180]|uniref:hypothetical protein n=1 Tax=Oscillatoria sp. CS-180 TaxID=3021720 RepID=UPI00232F6812|nr:hypothetical protein [Oscillatoria sp. CS-180]MDB9529921.1 hypothetical protein [Oscillatoria sp. CS-180]
MGILEWFKPEDESADRVVGEISNDSGDHAVFDVPADGQETVERIMRDNNVERDRDDQLRRQYDAARRVDQRDSEQHRYRMEPVVDSNEDLEPEQDDDSITERNEQPASGGWWPFG